MTYAELFDHITAQPSTLPQQDNTLGTLCKNMLHVKNSICREVDENMLNYKGNVQTSLPDLQFSAADLYSLELNSSLVQLYKGLASYKAHLDWIQKYEEDNSSKTKMISDHVRNIKHKVLQKIKAAVPTFDQPSLPPPKSLWELNQDKNEIIVKLCSFFDFFVR
ncbi:hypothetical protein DNTS_030602, partial [Danionella cerebrum]